MENFINDCLSYEKTTKENTITKNVLLYGTGTLAVEIFNLLKRKNYCVSDVLNRSLDFGKTFMQYKVKLPNDNSLCSLKENTVILGTFSAFADENEILEMFGKEGFKNIVTYPELLDIFPGELSSRYSLEDSESAIKRIKENHKKISTVYSMFSDEKSKKIFKELLRYRISKNISDIETRDEIEHIYFPEDIDLFKDNKKIRFVDCGAYNGDTLETLTDIYPETEAVTAFEPDKENYKELLDFVAKKNFIKEIHLYNSAVYSKKETLTFYSGGTVGSSLLYDTNKTEEQVECVSLDESISDFNPDYIKMDIEGAEREALEGCVNILKKCLPALAISMYHKPEDLFEIPLYLKELNLNYDFYLRIYGNYGLETILYAVENK